MELNEIKHYLGTGIKLQCLQDRVFKELTLGRCILMTQGEFDYKPIMHPLSDLIKPCLEDSKIPLVELAKTAYENIFHINEDFDTKEVLSEGENFGLIAYYDKERVSFTVQKECHWFEFCFYVDGSELHLNQLTLFQWLFEHHFDVFGLIERGEAIEINTIAVK